MLRLVSLLLLVSLSAAAAAPLPSSASDVMGGKCATVKSREQWKDKEDSWHWNLRIKVKPWTALGRINVELHGTAVSLTDVYFAELSEDDSTGTSYVLMLHPHAGPESTLLIQGVGELVGEAQLSCANLEASRTQVSHTSLAQVSHKSLTPLFWSPTCASAFFPSTSGFFCSI